MRRPPENVGIIPCEGHKERIFVLVFSEIRVAMRVLLHLVSPALKPYEVDRSPTLSTRKSARARNLIDDYRQLALKTGLISVLH